MWKWIKITSEMFYPVLNYLSIFYEKIVIKSIKDLTSFKSFSIILYCYFSSILWLNSHNILMLINEHLSCSGFPTSTFFLFIIIITLVTTTFFKILLIFCNVPGLKLNQVQNEFYIIKIIVAKWTKKNNRLRQLNL